MKTTQARPKPVTSMAEPAARHTGSPEGSPLKALTGTAQKCQVVAQLSTMQASANSSQVVQNLLGSHPAGPVVQRATVNDKGYAATTPGVDFREYHLGTEATAKEISESRYNDDRVIDTNTVLLTTAGDVNDAVKAHDFNKIYHHEGRQYTLDVSFDYVEVSLMTGDGEAIGTVGETETGNVRLKAYFNEGQNKNFKVTGITSG